MKPSVVSPGDPQHPGQRAHLRSRGVTRGIELRFFGGLSVQDTAAVMGVSQDTVMRDWKFARAWLQAELSQS